MPLITKRNSQTFMRFLYGGTLQPVTLLKRGDDQAEGTVTTYTLHGCWRDNIAKSGEAIQGDIAVSHQTTWLIPCRELRRVGVNYLNVLDRIVDQYGQNWQPESPQTITLSQAENVYILPCVRVDPTPNSVLLGVPGEGLLA